MRRQFRWAMPLACGGLVALIALQAARSQSGGVSAASAVVKVSPAELDESKRVAVTDDQMMTVTEGKGAQVADITPFTSTDKRFQVDVSAYDKVTLALKNWPVDEFMYFLEGRVEITDTSGHKQRFGPGDGLLMPRGFNGTWRQLSRIKKISAAYWPETIAKESTGVLRVDRALLGAAAMKPVRVTESYVRLISGGKGFVERSAYRSADGAASVDIKKFEPLVLEMRGWPIDELMVILSGEVEIVDASAHVTKCAAGEAFVIPRGFVGMWRQQSQVEMFTVSHGDPH